MFKKILALVLATMMVLGGMVTVSAAEEAAVAEEVATDYTAAAEYLAELDILKGSIVDNKIDFALENGVTRLQMALFIARIMTGETNDQYWSKVNDNTTPYDDVVNYFGAVSFADENGIIKGKGWIPGIGDNCFDPNGAITFQDAITMAVRALGYKQLQYPDGFVTVGEELGLTAGLEPLAKDAELTRGQMIQILKNMLLVKVNGAASFAEQNFGLEIATYVIVATNNQYMPGAERVLKKDYVALAKLNADGTYDYKNYIHAHIDELGLKADSADAETYVEMKLGYSYTVASYDKFATAAYEANPTVKYQNYGDEKNEIANGDAYNGIYAGSYVKLGGVNYELVSTYTNLNNKSTSVSNNDTEIIVHSMFDSSAKTSFQYYVYDIKGNIMAEDGTVGLYLINGTYYKKMNDATELTDAIFRVATEEDFAEYAYSVVDSSSYMYGVVTAASHITTSKFSEITLIDDNNDGVYDRGIYAPYSVAKYSVAKTSAKDKYFWDVTKSKAEKQAKGTEYVTLGGSALNAYVVDGNFKQVTIGSTPAGTAAAPYIFAKQVNYVNNKPAKDDYIVYYYNPYARAIVVIENLGKPVAGGLDNFTVGSYTWDGTYTTNRFSNSKITIDGTTYTLGYLPNVTYNQFGKTLENIDRDVNVMGYDAVIAEVLANKAYLGIKYLTLAGRVIYVDKTGSEYSWIAFDYGTKENVTTNGYTSYKYNGDIMGVDADGNILVKGFVDGNANKQQIAIASINGYNYGLLVEDYAALQYQYSGIGILQQTAFDTMKKIVILDFFKTLTNDLGQRQMMYVVNGKDENGAFHIYTDINLYWGNTAAYNTYRQPAYKTSDATVTFNYGYADVKTLDAQLVLTDKSVAIIIGKNGIETVTGIPAFGAKLNLAGAAIYEWSNSLIVVANPAKDAAEIFEGVTFDSAKVGTSKTYYMVIGSADTNYYKNTTAEITGWTATGKPVIKYNNLYNINTGALVSITVDGGLPYFTDLTNTNWYGITAIKPLGAIYSIDENGTIAMETAVPETGSADKLGSYKYAANSEAVLRDILAGMYDYVDGIAAKADTPNQLKLVNAGTKYDRITFTMDTITYTGAAVAVNATGAGSKDVAASTLFYNYVPGVSFGGVAIVGGAAPEIEVVIPDLAKAQADAIAALTTLADGKYDLTAAKAAINGALTVQEVAAQQAKYADLITKALGDAATEAAAHEAALNALKALLTSEADYLEAAIKDGSIYSIKDHIDSWVAVAASKTAAELTAAAKEVTDRVAALKAAAAGAVVKVAADNNTINVYTETAGLVTYVTYVKVYAKDDAGFWTNHVATIDPVSGAANGILSGFTATKDANAAENGTLITLAKFDAAGNPIPAFADGAEYLFVVTYANGAKTVSVPAIIG